MDFNRIEFRLMQKESIIYSLFFIFPLNIAMKSLRYINKFQEITLKVAL